MVGTTTIGLLLLDVGRWTWWVLRSLLPFFIGEEPVPDPPAYPPVGVGPEDVALFVLTVLLVIIAGPVLSSALRPRSGTASG